jgi:hypothetical protein
MATTPWRWRCIIETCWGTNTITIYVLLTCILVVNNDTVSNFVFGFWFSAMYFCIYGVVVPNVLMFQGTTNSPTQSHIPEEINPSKHWCENLASRSFTSVIHMGQHNQNFEHISTAAYVCTLNRCFVQHGCLSNLRKYWSSEKKFFLYCWCDMYRQWQWLLELDVTCIHHVTRKKEVHELEFMLCCLVLWYGFVFYVSPCHVYVNFHVQSPNIMIKWLALLLHIWEVLFPDLLSVAGFPAWAF